MSDKDLLIQITDHLFDKGFEISKPMMEEIVKFFEPVISAAYQQGINSAQSDNREVDK